MSTIVSDVDGSARGGRSAYGDASPAPATETVDARDGWFSRGGVYHESVEVGMSLTGPDGLAEAPLLKRLGDLRWRHISALTGVPSRDFRDTDGNRIYPAFFFVELTFPQERPVASYRESERVVLADVVRRPGEAVLDGTTYLLPAGSEAAGPWDLPGAGTGGRPDVPRVRLSNVFVASPNGPSDLTKSAPAHPTFDRIDDGDGAPGPYGTIREAKEGEELLSPGPDYVPIGPEPRREEYDIVRDRDINGAGLLYFAHYPVILDICERRVLESARPGFDPEALDRRTVVERKSAYLRNAPADDSVVVTVEPWVQDPRSERNRWPDGGAVRLQVNFRMHRESDGELMMVSSVRKRLHGTTVEELACSDALLRLTGERRGGREAGGGREAPLAGEA